MWWIVGYCIVFVFMYIIIRRMVIEDFPDKRGFKVTFLVFLAAAFWPLVFSLGIWRTAFKKTTPKNKS